MITIFQIRDVVALTLALILSFGAATPASTASPKPIQSYDAYQSWFVACDNVLKCVAKGFGDGNKAVEIKIERQAGPRGDLTVAIRAGNIFSLADIRIDGNRAGLSAPAWKLAVSDDETSASSSDLVAVRALVQRLRNASKLTLSGDGEVPLNGFAAAMLRFDERQGRLGGVTAIFRPGAIPASQIPAALAIPRIPAHPISAMLSSGEERRLIASVRSDQKAVFDEEGCETDIAATTPEAYALDAEQALVLLPCILGAYQGSSLAFIAPRAGGAAHRLIAPLPYESNSKVRSDASYLTESDFDPKTGTLSMAAKGRGMGDCGISASWIWNGSAFRITAMSLQESCGGIEPGDWPTMFRSIQ